MRFAPLLVFALLSACSPPGSKNDPQPDGSAPQANGPAATISVASGPEGNCTAKWDGVELSQAAIRERATQLLMARIEAIGGPAAITQDNLPFLRVEAAPAMRWPCAGQILASLQHAGYAEALLRPTGARDGPDQRLHLPVGSVAANSIHLFPVGPGGAIKQDGQLHDRPALRDFARANSAGGPDDFSIAPTADASFGDVYQTLIDLRVSGAGVMLAAPAQASAETAPPPPPTAF